MGGRAPLLQRFLEYQFGVGIFVLGRFNLNSQKKKNAMVDRFSQNLSGGRTLSPIFFKRRSAFFFQGQRDVAGVTNCACFRKGVGDECTI